MVLKLDTRAPTDGYSDFPAVRITPLITVTSSLVHLFYFIYLFIYLFFSPKTLYLHCRIALQLQLQAARPFSAVSTKRASEHVVAEQQDGDCTEWYILAYLLIFAAK